MINEAVLKKSDLIWSDMAERTSQPTPAQSDYLLARKIAGGDMEAFEELYQRYHRRVYNLCLRMIRNVAEAEDLTQDIFIHVYYKIGSFRGESTMNTWLHRVTVNKVLMHFRRNNVRREQVTADGQSPEPVTIPAKSLGQTPAIDRIALDDAISKLPPGYRTVFLLHDVEGYEHSEIARMLGNSIGTSKSQLHKARKKLMELIKTDYH